MEIESQSLDGTQGEDFQQADTELSSHSKDCSLPSNDISNLLLPLHLSPSGFSPQNLEFGYFGEGLASNKLTQLSLWLELA
jgi:hypothetical protein